MPVELYKWIYFKHDHYACVRITYGRRKLTRSHSGRFLPVVLFDSYCLQRIIVFKSNTLCSIHMASSNTFCEAFSASVDQFTIPRYQVKKNRITISKICFLQILFYKLNNAHKKRAPKLSHMYRKKIFFLPLNEQLSLIWTIARLRCSEIMSSKSRSQFLALMLIMDSSSHSFRQYSVIIVTLFSVLILPILFHQFMGRTESDQKCVWWLFIITIHQCDSVTELSIVCSALELDCWDAELNVERSK